MLRVPALLIRTREEINYRGQSRVVEDDVEVAGFRQRHEGVWSLAPNAITEHVVQQAAVLVRNHHIFRAMQ